MVLYNKRSNFKVGKIMEKNLIKFKNLQKSSQKNMKKCIYM